MSGKVDKPTLSTPAVAAAAVPILPTMIPSSQDTPLKGINGKNLSNKEGIINTKVFGTLVACGDEELVRALTANILNALEESFRQVKTNFEKQDLIGMAISIVRLIPRVKAIGFRRVGESIESFINYISTVTAPPPSTNPEESKEVTTTTDTVNGKKPKKKEETIPTGAIERQIKYEEHLNKAMELLKVVEKETKKVEDLMLRYNGEAGLNNLDS